MYPILSLLMVLVAVTHLISAQEYSKEGCRCIGSCSRTIDSLTQPWCYTSVVDPPDTGEYCGKYSVVKRAYWDECTVNVTSNEKSMYLTSLDTMWATITVSAVGTMMTTFFLVGIVAAFMSGLTRNFFWLPCAASCIGGCQGLCMGGVFAVCVSFMYLSLPYAIEFNVAISLGVSIGAILTYASLGRQYNTVFQRSSLKKTG